MTRLRHLVLPVIAVAALSTAACSGSNENASSNAPASMGKAQPGGTGDFAGTDALTAAEAPAPAYLDSAARSAFDTSQHSANSATQDRAVIQTGAVSLRSDDVAKARFELDKLLTKHDGLIDDERTVTDKQGEVRMTRLVVRVPSSDFSQAMNELAKLGTLVESSQKAKDVTTEVIDTDVRIRAQQESLSRVETLLARANSIRDIMAIEAQLTRRQADLDALKQNQAYLKDQTEMSTITVYVERTDVSPEPVGPTKHHNPFVAGLISGWDAFTDVAGGLAKAVGATLPFLPVLLVLGWPLVLMVRRLGAISARTTEVAAPTEA